MTTSSRCQPASRRETTPSKSGSTIRAQAIACGCLMESPESCWAPACISPSLLRDFVERFVETRRELVEEVVDFWHGHCSGFGFELALGDGELAVTDGQFHGALEIRVQCVRGFDPSHEVGIAFALVDQRAVGL